MFAFPARLILNSHPGLTEKGMGKVRHRAGVDCERKRADEQKENEYKNQEMDFKLRKWEKSDLNSLVKHADNINIARWLTNQFPFPYTPESGKSYLAMIENDNPVKVFAIEIEGEAAGSIGIFPQADIHEKSAEIGYWLSEKYWRNGIMPKAVQEIVKYGFETFDIVRIYARPFSTNAGSRKVLEKAGFELEAILKKALYKNHEYMDELIYVKFRE